MVAASACTSARVRLVSNWVANCEASASSAWAPKEAKAATAAMERKRAVLFMMDKSLKLKKRLKKAGSKPFLNRVRCVALRVRLIGGLNCTPMVFRKKPPSRKLTVPVLETIRPDRFRVYPNFCHEVGRERRLSGPNHVRGENGCL